MEQSSLPWFATDIMTVQIKVKSDAAPVRYVEHGIEFSDGTVLDADIVVHATGFASNMRGEVYRLFGAKVGDKVEDFWGLDKEGEISGAFRPCGRRSIHDCKLLDKLKLIWRTDPGLWLHGGTSGQARWMSRFIALQVKAMIIGSPLPLYSDTPS